MLTSIIIPIYNQYEFSKACIDSIIKNTDMKNTEIIIIDNGSEPEVINPLYIGYSNMKNFVFYSFDKNEGFPKAINKGIDLAKGKFICLLNNDCIVTLNWLDIMLEHFKRSTVGIVSPCTNYCAGMQGINIGRYNNEEELNKKSKEFYDSNSGKFDIVNWAIGFCMLIKKEVVDKVGKFDEGFGMGNSEDIDFCLRAGDNNYEVLIARDCYVHHYGSRTHRALYDSKGYNDLLIKNSDKLLDKRKGIHYDQRIFYRSWETAISC